LYNITANTEFTGKSQVFLPTCHSTNESAQELLAQGNVKQGTLVITDHQTAGKGQMGNMWEAEMGRNLTFSLIFKPNSLSLNLQFFLNIITSLAVRETVAFFINERISVKWPNDIYLNDNKVSGILVQTAIRSNLIHSAVIGIGLNVNQDVFADKKAVSMKNISREEFSKEKVLNRLLENLEYYFLKLEKGALLELKDNYTENMYRVHQKSLFKVNNEVFEGAIVGVSLEGMLLLSTDEGEKRFNFKEIAFLD